MTKRKVTQTGTRFVFRGFEGGDISSRGLLGCDTMQCCGRIPTFQRSMLPPSSPCGVTTQKTSTWIFTAVKASIFALHPEDGESMNLW